MKVYVENVEKVVTDLYSFSGETRAVLKHILRAIAERIATRERASLGGHSRSGKQAASVRTTVKEYGDRLVSASAVVGGNKRVRYGHAFERGFDGAVQVPAHESRSRFGKRFSVRAYQMHHKVRAHGYLAAALHAEAASAPVEIGAAIGAVAQRKGLA
jgi:hypothetical protein